MRFFLLLLLFSTEAFSESFESKIHDIHFSAGEESLVLFENGRVGFLPANEKLSDLFHFKQERERLLINIDTQHTIVSMWSSAEESPPGSAAIKSGFSYEASVLDSVAKASQIFSRFKQGWQNESQCYNRAHIWAYEAFQESSLKSIKLFLFFTSRYIRNYRFKWWFHVAPMTLVRINGKNYPKVLDRRYTSGPRDIRAWTNIFMKNKAECPLVRKYSDYRNKQNAQDCYLLPANMYYYQPRDLELLERRGRIKSGFIQSEVNWAYREAF